MMQWIVLCVRVIHCIVVTSDQAVQSLPTSGLKIDLFSILQVFPMSRFPDGFLVQNLCVIWSKYGLQYRFIILQDDSFEGAADQQLYITRNILPIKMYLGVYTCTYISRQMLRLLLLETQVARTINCSRIFRFQYGKINHPLKQVARTGQTRAPSVLQSTRLGIV